MSKARLLLKAGKLAAWDPYVLPRSVLKAWWSADDHGTANMTDDGAGLISSWIDRISGITTTAVTSARPTWSATSFNSAYPGITFDGVANCLVNTSFAALPQTSTPGEMWAIANYASNDGSLACVVFRYGTTGSAACRDIRQGTLNQARISDGASFLDDTAIVFSGNHILGGMWSDTTMSGRVDGRDLNPASLTVATLNTGNTRLRIGASNSTSAATFMHGVIRHLFITTTLTSLQRQQLEAWLAWNSNLQTLLPTSHPYYSVRP